MTILPLRCTSGTCTDRLVIFVVMGTLHREDLPFKHGYSRGRYLCTPAAQSYIGKNSELERCLSHVSPYTDVLRVYFSKVSCQGVQHRRLEQWTCKGGIVESFRWCLLYETLRAESVTWFPQLHGPPRNRGYINDPLVVCLVCIHFKL